MIFFCDGLWQLLQNRCYIQRVLGFCNTIIKRGLVMAVDSKLQLAADAIQDAKKRMERAKDNADDDYEIRQALKILDEAAEYIRGAISELSKGG